MAQENPTIALHAYQFDPGDPLQPNTPEIYAYAVSHCRKKPRPTECSNCGYVSLPTPRPVNVTTRIDTHDGTESALLESLVTTVREINPARIVVLDDAVATGVKRRAEQAISNSDAPQGLSDLVLDLFDADELLTLSDTVLDIGNIESGTGDHRSRVGSVSRRVCEVVPAGSWEYPRLRGAVIQHGELGQVAGKVFRDAETGDGVVPCEREAVVEFCEREARSIASVFSSVSLDAGFRSAAVL